MPIQKTSREEIIQKSISVFRQRGYYRTNMSDLARHCGLTKGAFYHHFQNKEQVMRVSLEMTSGYFKKWIFSTAYDKGIAEEDRLKTMLERYLKTFLNEKGGCFMANTILETSQVEDTFKDVMLDFFDAWEKALVEIFKTKYEEEAAAQKAIQVITDLEGAIILMQLRDNPKFLKDAVKKCTGYY